jgi:hypothetical protein
MAKRPSTPQQYPPYRSGRRQHAAEIKNTRRPSSRDVNNLLEFSRGMKKNVKMYLFYPGDEYFSINEVKFIPVAGIFGGA